MDGSDMSYKNGDEIRELVARVDSIMGHWRSLCIQHENEIATLRRALEDAASSKSAAMDEVDRLTEELRQARASVLRHAISHVRTTGVSEPVAGWAPDGYYHERMIGLGCAMETLREMIFDEEAENDE